MPDDDRLHFEFPRVARVSLSTLPPAETGFLRAYLDPFFQAGEQHRDGGAVPLPQWTLAPVVQAADDLDALVRSRSRDLPPGERGVVRDGSSWLAWYRDQPRDPWTVERVSPGHRVIEVRMASTAQNRGYALARAIRSLLATLAGAAGWVQVHASAFAFGDAGVLIVGDKGVGKTSLLITALTQGAAFISNDRVLIQPAAPGPPVRGLPHSVTVRAGTGAEAIMRGTQSSYGDHQPENRQQSRYHVSDVLRATRSRISPSSRLALVVAPEVGPAGVRLDRIPAGGAAKFLEQAHRPSISSFDPLWDAWRSQLEADADPGRTAAWPPAAGIRLEYGPQDAVDAVETIREETSS